MATEIEEEGPNKFSFYPNGIPFDAPKDGKNSYSINKLTKVKFSASSPFDNHGIEMMAEEPYDQN